jgi:hypothetical protein
MKTEKASIETKVIALQLQPTIIVECWGSFKKLCSAKGWKHQTLSNAKLTPQIGNPVTIQNLLVFRVAVDTLYTSEIVGTDECFTTVSQTPKFNSQHIDN